MGRLASISGSLRSWLRLFMMGGFLLLILSTLVVPLARVADLNSGYLIYLRAKLKIPFMWPASCCGFDLAAAGTDQIAARAHVGQARVALELDDPAKAISILEADRDALAARMGSLVLGGAFLVNDNWLEAAKSWRRAGVSAEYILRQAEVPEAQLYSFVLEVAPTSQTYYELGLHFQERNRSVDAISAYESAIQLDSGWKTYQDRLIAWYRLALLYSASQSQYDKRSESFLREALGLSYSMANQRQWQILLLRRLATRAFGQANYDQTVYWISDAKQLRLPLLPSDHLLLGKAIYLTTRDVRSASEFFDLALLGEGGFDANLVLEVGSFWVEQNEFTLAEHYCHGKGLSEPESTWQEDICQGLIWLARSNYDQAFVFLTEALNKGATPEKARLISSYVCKLSDFSQQAACKPLR